MENSEIEILLVEENELEAEKTIHILRKNNIADKLVHLKDAKEANDFIFCTGAFEKRNIQDQPRAILYNVKMLKFHDIEFLDRINADERTKKIALVVLSSIEDEKLIKQ